MLGCFYYLKNPSIVSLSDAQKLLDGMNQYLCSEPSSSNLSSEASRVLQPSKSSTQFIPNEETTQLNPKTIKKETLTLENFKSNTNQELALSDIINAIIISKTIPITFNYG